MKIKDFLQNFVGQSTDTLIEVYDKHSFKTYQFHPVQEVIDRLGYYSVKEWTICDNILKISFISAGKTASFRHTFIRKRGYNIWRNQNALHK